MKITAWAIVMATLFATSAQAQDTKGDHQHVKAYGCMVMSDSMSTALGLTSEQIAQVRESDARCLKACEQAGFRTTGKMDHAAMSTHDAEMKEILTTEQYAKWNAMCNTSKAQKSSARPGSMESSPRK